MSKRADESKAASTNPPLSPPSETRFASAAAFDSRTHMINMTAQARELAGTKLLTEIIQRVPVVATQQAPAPTPQRSPEQSSAKKK